MAYVEENISLVDSILWSDEVVFKLNGHINRHNCIYWRCNNTHENIEKEVPPATSLNSVRTLRVCNMLFWNSEVLCHSAQVQK